MKLAASSEAAVSVGEPRAEQPKLSDAFLACHALLISQPDAVARRLGRLLRQAERAIKSQNATRFVQARKLEEAVGYIAELRRGHAESQQIQRHVARLLHEAFGTPNWRAGVIDGLRAAELGAAK